MMYIATDATRERYRWLRDWCEKEAGKLTGDAELEKQGRDSNPRLLREAI